MVDQMSLSSRLQKRRRKRWRLPVIVLLICVVSYGIYATVYRKDSVYGGLSKNDEVQLKTGEPIAAKEGIPPAKDLVAAMPNPATTRQDVDESELYVDFKFWYRPPKNTGNGINPNSSVALTSAEPYYLTVRPSEPCYLYVLQRRSSGRMSTLFPNSKYSPVDNPISPAHLRIPTAPNWIYLDDRVGTEAIYLVAAKYLQPELDAFVQNSDLRSTELVTILSELSQKALNDPELVYSEYFFNHLQ